MNQNKSAGLASQLPVLLAQDKQVLLDRSNHSAWMPFRLFQFQDSRFELMTCALRCCIQRVTAYSSGELGCTHAGERTESMRELLGTNLVADVLANPGRAG